MLGIQNSFISRHKASGFTIVELLVVVVVISILASITVVAYGGITDRARAVQGQSTARSVAEKIELWNILEGSYPTYAQLVTNSLAPTPASGGGYDAGGVEGPVSAKIPDSISIVNGSYPTQENEVSFLPCPSGGGAVVYQDPTASAPPMSYVTWGNPVDTITYGSGPNCY